MKFRIPTLLALVFSAGTCLAGPGGGPPSPAAAPPPPGFPIESDLLILLSIVLISIYIFKKTTVKTSK